MAVLIWWGDLSCFIRSMNKALASKTVTHSFGYAGNFLEELCVSNAHTWLWAGGRAGGRLTVHVDLQTLWRKAH